MRNDGEYDGQREKCRFATEGLRGFIKFSLFKGTGQNETTQVLLMTDLALLCTLLAGFSLLALIYTFRRDRYLTELRGPEPSSFWLGNFLNSTGRGIRPIG